MTIEVTKEQEPVMVEIDPPQDSSEQPEMLPEEQALAKKHGLLKDEEQTETLPRFGISPVTTPYPEPIFYFCSHAITLAL